MPRIIEPQSEGLCRLGFAISADAEAVTDCHVSRAPVYDRTTQSADLRKVLRAKSERPLETSQREFARGGRAAASAAKLPWPKRTSVVRRTVY